MKLTEKAKCLFIAISSLVALGCSPGYQPNKIDVLNLHLGDSTYPELVDFLYEFAGKNRLTILWSGWYKVEGAKEWYERSDGDSTFKVKLELLTEENGSLVFSSYFDKSIASLSIDYADKKPLWMAIVKELQNDIESRGWHIEHIKTNVLN